MRCAKERTSRWSATPARPRCRTRAPGWCSEAHRAGIRVSPLPGPERRRRRVLRRRICAPTASCSPASCPPTRRARRKALEALECPGRSSSTRRRTALRRPLADLRERFGTARELVDLPRAHARSSRRSPGCRWREAAGWLARGRNAQQGEFVLVLAAGDEQPRSHRRSATRCSICCWKRWRRARQPSSPRTHHRRAEERAVSQGARARPSKIRGDGSASRCAVPTTGICTCATARCSRDGSGLPPAASRAPSSCRTSSRAVRTTAQALDYRERILGDAAGRRELRAADDALPHRRHAARGDRARQAFRPRVRRQALPGGRDHPLGCGRDADLALLPHAGEDGGARPAAAGARRGRPIRRSTCSTARRRSSRKRSARCSSAFPRLKVVLEHITTREAAQFVEVTGPNVAATITAHHLLMQPQRALHRRHPAAPLLPAGAQARGASRGAGRGRDLGQSEVLPRHRQRAARAPHQGDAPAAAPASIPRTPRSSSMPRPSRRPARSTSWKASPACSARSSTACRSTTATSRWCARNGRVPETLHVRRRRAGAAARRRNDSLEARLAHPDLRRGAAMARGRSARSTRSTALAAERTSAPRAASPCGSCRPARRMPTTRSRCSRPAAVAHAAGQPARLVQCARLARVPAHQGAHQRAARRARFRARTGGAGRCATC